MPREGSPGRIAAGVAILCMAISAADLAFSHGSGLVYAGWINPPDNAPSIRLPLRWLPVLVLPIAVAVYGYVRTIVRLLRERSAKSAWLVGLAGHLTYLMAGTVLAGLNLAATPAPLALLGLTVMILPGLLIFRAEWRVS